MVPEPETIVPRAGRSVCVQGGRRRDLVGFQYYFELFGDVVLLELI